MCWPQSAQVFREDKYREECTFFREECIWMVTRTIELTKPALCVCLLTHITRLLLSFQSVNLRVLSVNSDEIIELHVDTNEEFIKNVSYSSYFYAYYFNLKTVINHYNLDTFALLWKDA